MAALITIVVFGSWLTVVDAMGWGPLWLHVVACAAGFGLGRIL